MVSFCCVLCSTTTAVLRTAVVIQDGWVNRFVGKVCPRVRGLRFFFFAPVVLAPPWHSSAYNYSSHSLLHLSAAPLFRGTADLPFRGRKNNLKQGLFHPNKAN